MFIKLKEIYIYIILKKNLFDIKHYKHFLYEHNIFIVPHRGKKCYLFYKKIKYIINKTYSYHETEALHLQWDLYL